jgi:hypothetical protein
MKVKMFGILFGHPRVIVKNKIDRLLVQGILPCETGSWTFIAKYEFFAVMCYWSPN